jgi:hypothetical protein
LFSKPVSNGSPAPLPARTSTYVKRKSWRESIGGVKKLIVIGHG